MEVVANSYLPGDPHLVDKIVYELKAQGIFDQFRKECFADVDTKPAYQNLRQRVENSVAAFLKDQSWKPDMNKNQVREMLRKTITESGFLETGVERIVDQVVNPKINTIFLPKVEEVVYSHLGLQKPNRVEHVKSVPCDLLPNDLEAVSPESEPTDKKDDKSTESFQDLDETKVEEDESPPFEPLEEQSSYVPQEENSVDSHMSGFSGLVSHESNQSNENKVVPMEQDSQMSRNSSDSRLSIVTSDENSKMEISEDSQSRSMKGSDSNSKPESDKGKDKHKSSDKHKSRSESKHDRDRKSSKDSKSRHSSTSSKDNKDKRDVKTTSKNEKDKDKPKESRDKERKSSSSSNKHSSHSSKDKDRDRNGKKDSSKSDKDKKSSSHKDSKTKEKSSDSKTKEKSSDKHKHSSSSHKRDKDKRKDSKSKDDHYSSRDKKNERRSTDRDSNDGQSSRPNQSTTTEGNSSQGHKSSQESNSGNGDVGNADHDNTTKAPVVITGAVENSEVSIIQPERLKVFKPKCAANMKEALKLIKIRKQLARLEKKNQLSLTSVEVNSTILQTASIDLDDIKKGVGNGEGDNMEVVPPPLQNTVISQDNWDAMEEKLRKEVCSEFKEHNDDSMESEKDEFEGDCKYFEPVDVDKIEFLIFIRKYIASFEQKNKPLVKKNLKTKIEDTDLKNNNNHLILTKKPRLLKKNKEKLSHVLENVSSDKFSLPLSPAESDKSFGKKDENSIIPAKGKRNNTNKVNSQRYSSDDLYKPRPTFASSRRRGAKNLDN